MTWDLLLLGGHVVDPRNRLDGRYDVAIVGGRIAEVGEDLPRQAKQVINLAGLTLVPGLIDLHTPSPRNSQGGSPRG